MLTHDQRRRLRFDADGLLTAVVQDHHTGEVLMVAWMDAAALTETIERREAVFWSRSRQRRWRKGETSGNVQRVLDLRIDCDGDTVLLLVEPRGAGVACHTGQRSCFHRRLPGAPAADTPAGPPLAADEPPPPSADRVRTEQPTTEEPRP